MAYLPGVPNMSPAPVSTSPAGGSASKGGPSSGIAKTALAVGKPGRTQGLGNITGRHMSGASTITGGDPMAHSMQHYGKKPPPLLGGLPAAPGINPTAHPGSKEIRGGAGGIKPHVKTGGLGPGRLSTPGASNSDYSMTDTDPE